MAAARPTRHDPVIYAYLKKYQEDPTSRVFAPLAEAYRKAGLIDEAIEIAREGLRVHPHFTGGKVALARALFDKKLYEEVLAELAAVVRDTPDNLIAQRLFAESCLILGRTAEALDAFKLLLYFSPDDREISKMVKELEEQAYRGGSLVLRTDPATPETGATADPRALKIRQIERLQGLLQKLERYRVHSLG
jgi:tetratricopeptide (TPR) repeat protein